MENKAWIGDALDRKPHADYLTQTLIAQAQDLAEKGAGLTVSLDADWGACKTFFVKNWAEDLRAVGHPVVYFDAWVNDIGDEAAISLMAEIISALRGSLSLDLKIAAKADGFAKQSIRNLRRAILPVAGVVLKGLIKKAAAIGVDDLLDALNGTDADGPELVDSSALDSTLDKIFEKALEEHQSRKEQVNLFKKALNDLLNLVFSSRNKLSPLFVFIDELDRCRPSYALNLLEEVKHIFGIKNVVYVISTNLGQLQNSVRAVYGAEFDGRRYLMRFFDRHYSLPDGNGLSFAEMFVKESG